MRQSRVPLELLAPLMGHSSTKMLEKVYGKLDASELVKPLKDQRVCSRSLDLPAAMDFHHE
jgi:hypothetical protein